MRRPAEARKNADESMKNPYSKAMSALCDAAMVGRSEDKLDVMIKTLAEIKKFKAANLREAANAPFEVQLDEMCNEDVADLKHEAATPDNIDFLYRLRDNIIK